MKRLMLLCCVGCLALPLCLGQLQSTRVTPVMLSSPQNRWMELGTLTAAQAYPSAANRDYPTVAAIVDANTIVWNLDNYARKAMLSFQTNADADSTTVVLLGFADAKMTNTSGTVTVDDDAVYLGTLVLTGGTQVGSHSNVYVDTIAATDGAASFTVLDSATNRRGCVEFNTKGFKRIVVIATTLQASSTLYAEGRLFQ